MQQDMKVNLQGKVAIVTGSTQGLGADIALALCTAGAWVLIVGRSQEEGQRTEARLQAVGDGIWAVYNLRETWKRLGPPVETVKHAVAAPGRNDPCPCGSGKKYKQCHGKLA